MYDPTLRGCNIVDLVTPYLAWKKDNDQLLAECKRQSTRRKRFSRYTSVHRPTGEGLLQEYFYTQFRQMSDQARAIPGELPRN